MSRRDWPYRLGDLVLVIIFTALVVLILCYLPVWLEQRDSASTDDARAQQKREQHRDLAAARLCRESVGPSSFTWNTQGQLVCIPRAIRQVASNF